MFIAFVPRLFLQVILTAVQYVLQYMLTMFIAFVPRLFLDVFGFLSAGLFSEGGFVRVLMCGLLCMYAVSILKKH
jgi:hypothetical protein